jgi:hypothetical protein
VFSVSPSVGGTGGYNTHLTVDRTGRIECDQIKDYGNEGGNACQRINPDCPPIWAVAFDYTQFIIESDEELPDENSIHDMVELHYSQDILFDDGGILEIYHLFKQGTETEGQWGWRRDFGALEKAVENR